MGLPKVTRRFVAERVLGMQGRGSFRLTKVGRALGERISLKKTEERLSRPLGGSGKHGSWTGAETRVISLIICCITSAGS